jgi:glycosyltransferase involved in cell wall biosynthesis
VNESLALIIPARNESGVIGELLSDIRVHASSAIVIVIDDCSTDDTYITAAGKASVVLRPPLSLGIGAAVQLGIRYAFEKGCTTFIRIDGDGQHGPENIGALCAALRPDALIVGSRPAAEFSSSSHWLRKAGSSFFQFLFSFCAHVVLPDPTSGFACFGREIAAQFVRYYPSEYPEIESAVLLHRAGYDIIPVEVHMQSRREGRSSITLFKAAVYMISVTIAFLISFFRENPYQRRGRPWV